MATLIRTVYSVALGCTGCTYQNKYAKYATVATAIWIINVPWWAVRRHPRKTSTSKNTWLIWKGPPHSAWNLSPWTGSNATNCTTSNQIEKIPRHQEFHCQSLDAMNPAPTSILFHSVSQPPLPPPTMNLMRPDRHNPPKRTTMRTIVSNKWSAKCIA